MISLSKENTDQLKNLLKDKKRIAILTHVNPDGDAIGSSLGLYHILKNHKHDVQVITPNDYPEFLQWLPGNDDIISYHNKAKKANEILRNAQLVFALDFNHSDRLDKMESIFAEINATKILIDHHPYPQSFADITFSFTQVSSTAELVYLIIHEMGLSMHVNKNAATCLYTGIMTDTGCFNYNCSNPSTFITASKLIEREIEIDKISIRVYDNYSSERMQLMGYCLNEKMKVYPEFKTAIISLTRNELEKYNFKPGDTEGFVNLPLSIKGMVLSIFIMEKNDHVKLSFRSRGSFAANDMAGQYFSGGGHFNAAGGQYNASVDETIKQIERLLEQYKNQLLNAI